MGNFLRRGAPALALTGTAVALVALFDPGVSALAGNHSASAAGLKSKPVSAKDNTATAPTVKPQSDGGSKSTPSQQPTPDATTQAASDCSNAKEYTGPVVDTRWGPVQVKAAVANGTVCSADAVQYPDGDRRSAQISQYAVPILNDQAVSQNGQISGVSGASYTSSGYQQSLQSLLSSAH